MISKIAGRRREWAPDDGVATMPAMNTQQRQLKRGRGVLFGSQSEGTAWHGGGITVEEP